MADALATLPLLYSGKGKDMREIPIPQHSGLLLQYFRNTLSTHNRVHLTEIPDKGEMITAQTLWIYLEVLLPAGTPTHIVAWGRDIYRYLPPGEYPPDLHRRAFIVQQSRKPEVEFVFRDYLTGSWYRALQETGRDPYGLGVSADLPLMHRFEHAQFTPTAKSENDEPLDARETIRAHRKVYETAAFAFVAVRERLSERGVVLVDAKEELDPDRQGEPMLIDDWFNGDCARMCLPEDIHEGRDPPFLDKERFRKLAERRWDGGPKVPLTFSEDEVREGMVGYHEALERISGMNLTRFRAELTDAEA